ncbi:MAG: sigma-54-dependent Fis family transcriptional regulator [Planctomycetes bacterium]|nr:sigma-54-dependent Fis family transcriptional regulator [Planctomycetota bacterium]
MPVTLVHKPKGVPAERVLVIGGFQPDFYLALRQTPWLVEEILDGAEALADAARRDYGVVVCSLRMRNTWGLDVLDAILKADPLTPVIMSTGEQSPKIVVEAMQRGAFDYVIEPYADLAYVIGVIGRAVRRRAAVRRGHAIREELQSAGASFLHELVGLSEALRELCERIRQVAPAHSPVLIEGESGSGKELVARAIHMGSARRHGPFVAVHCGAIPESLLESELFGHEKGAFTGAESTRVGVFEAAHDGTLFLDEIGLTSPACQAKLLRALESGAIRRVGANRELPVDVRFVSATNEPLDGLVAGKRFRQDLFFRLNVVGLRVPALRERREDIPLLCHHFAERFAKEAGKPFEAFSQAALDALQAYSFPGNVRELRNVIERAVVFARGPVIGTAELPEAIRNLGRTAPEPATGPADAGLREAYLSLSSGPGSMGLYERLAAVERTMIEQALVLSKGNRSHAAKLLRIKRTTLLQKLARQGLAEKGKAGKPRRASPAKRKSTGGGRAK